MEDIKYPFYIGMQDINNIYNNILDGALYIKNLRERKGIRREIGRNIGGGGLNTETIYFPNKIKNYINENNKTKIKYNLRIDGREIEVTFYKFSNRNISLIDNYADYVFIIIYVLGLYTSSGCSKFLEIEIFLTPFKKKFPKIRADQLDIINVNSGFSNFGCRNSSKITIYREEEWFKVLIHELFHNLNLDFSTRNIDKWRDKMGDICEINSEYNIFETYCELWARIINVIFTTFLILTERNDFSQKSFREIFKILIVKEKNYSLIQSKIVYENIYKNRMFREKSNVFCYYILVGILFNNYIKFINWSKTNNINILKFRNTEKNIDSFMDLILNEYLNLENNDVFNKIKIKKGNSLRMSIISVL